MLDDELSDANDEWAVRAGRTADVSTIETEIWGGIVSSIEGGSSAH